MATIQELFDLTGRVSVIKGGSAGLGLQMARGLEFRHGNDIVGRWGRHGMVVALLMIQSAAQGRE